MSNRSERVESPVLDGDETFTLEIGLLEIGKCQNCPKMGQMEVPKTLPFSWKERVSITIIGKA